MIEIMYFSAERPRSDGDSLVVPGFPRPVTPNFSNWEVRISDHHNDVTSSSSHA